jgi:hypothetical protein
MSELRERTMRLGRPIRDEAALPGRHARTGGVDAALRVLGGLAVLVVGAVHLEQYVGVHFDVVPIIGPLFLLNFIGATAIGLGLLIPHRRIRPVHALLAPAGIGLAATSFVFLFVSEHQPLFGFRDYGYRAAIILALAAEAVAVLSLGAYLVSRVRRRAG